MSCCFNFFRLTIITSGTFTNLFSGFRTARFFAYCPLPKSMSKGFYFVGYIAISTVLTCVRCVSSFCTGRGCYYCFVIMSEGFDFLCLAVITSGALAYFFSRFRTACFFDYCPLAKIVSKGFYLIICVTISTYLTCISYITCFDTSCCCYNFLIIMTDSLYLFTFTVIASITPMHFFSGFRATCFFDYRPLSEVMSKRFYLFGYITVSTYFACEGRITIFSTCRICYYYFVIMSECFDFSSLTIITSQALAYLFSGLCTSCFFDYRPLSEIMPQCFYLFGYITVSTYFTYESRITIFSTCRICYYCFINMTR